MSLLECLHSAQRLSIDSVRGIFPASTPQQETRVEHSGSTTRQSAALAGTPQAAETVKEGDRVGTLQGGELVNIERADPAHLNISLPQGGYEARDIGACRIGGLDVQIERWRRDSCPRRPVDQHGLSVALQPNFCARRGA